MSEIADFKQLLYDVEALLRRDQRIAYRILKRRFALDNEDIEDLKADLIDAKRIAFDERGKVLVYSANQPPERRAERRQLTVVFCDIVGSTELSEGLDPEDLRELIRRYQQTCGQIVDAAHGHIAQFLGDGLLVYFGYPIAYEDAAVRAVSCGLDIIGAVSQIKKPSGQPLQVRLGIHTGTVVIGDIGTGENREQLALGDTPNIAARIEAQARPNELIISETTRRLLRDSFDYDNRGETSLRGVAAPVPLYVVKRARDLPSQYAAAQRANQTALAGREVELAKLKDAWEIAKQGNHSKYFIHAEPGIGKSRLVQEIRETIRSDGGTPMTVVCSPLHSDTALYPFIELIHRVLRVRQEDSSALRLERLRDVLSSLQFPVADTEDTLAALLSIKHEYGESFANLDPKEREQRTFDTVLDWMFEVTTRTPVLLVVEDLQAADRSTLDLIEQGLDQFEDSPTLMVLVAREEFKPPWGRRGDIVDMPLRRLEVDGIKAIISSVCGGCELPAELVSQIEAKSDGVPLYAEEFTKMVIESDLLVNNDSKYELVRALSNLAIPSSLQDSLMARLDRLSDGKVVAQWGATIGREFSFELIHALLPDETATNGLKELIDLGVIYKRKRTLQTTFLFKHALIRDAAYGYLLRSERREYHARIARELLDNFSSTVAEHPEVVARHLTSAQRYEDAVAYWLAAGKRAGERAMNKEGLAHFNNGLRLLKKVPTGRARDTLELRLQMARGPLLMPLMGNGSEAVRETFARALELSKSLHATTDRFPILFGLRSYSLASGDLSKAHTLSLELNHIAEESSDPGQRLEAHTALANTSFFRGDFVEVENQARAAMKIYDRKRYRNHVHVYGSDPGVLCLSRLSNASWQRGHPDRGRADLVEMLALAEDLGHLFTLTSSLNTAALLRLWRCEAKIAFECANRAFEVSKQHSYPFPNAWSRMLRGQALFDLGEREDGMHDLTEGFEQTKTLSAKLMEPWFIALLANAKSNYGQTKEAATLLDSALQIVAESGTTYSLPALHCLKGELLVRDPPAEGSSGSALESFTRAANIARSHGSLALEVRATVGIIKNCASDEQRASAIYRLQATLKHFSAGDDSKDLLEAMTLTQT
jgi:class 3 adenylate cyclase/tetratricopeptide (TPR) repeat protein